MQDASRANLAASRGVAVREFVLKPPHGRADDLLFVDGAAAGVIEAKKEGEIVDDLERSEFAAVAESLGGSVEPRAEG